MIENKQSIKKMTKKGTKKKDKNRIMMPLPPKERHEKALPPSVKKTK